VHSVQWRVQQKPMSKRFLGPIRVGNRGSYSPGGLKGGQRLVESGLVGNRFRT